MTRSAFRKSIMDPTTSSHTVEVKDDYLLYDNECPFCSAYVKLVRLRKAGIDLKLLEGRTHLDLVRQHAAEGRDINEGMVLRLNGQTYFGGDVMNVLALMSTPSGPINILNKAIFSSRTTARLLYPALRAGRNLTIRLRGQQPIKHSR